jgi:hypothetical protein
LFETFSCSFKLLSCSEQAHREAFIWICSLKPFSVVGNCCHI